jgi:hypothetical protein
VGAPRRVSRATCFRLHSNVARLLDFLTDRHDAVGFRRKIRRLSSCCGSSSLESVCSSSYHSRRRICSSWITGEEMMCNGHNHSPGCRCGFGGDTGGHDAVSYGLRYSAREVVTRAGTWQTSCWWCGARVYFYRNDSGSCALFDELGYPWPVHGCWKSFRGSRLTSILSAHAQFLATPPTSHWPPADRLSLVVGIQDTSRVSQQSVTQLTAEQLKLEKQFWKDFGRLNTHSRKKVPETLKRDARRIFGPRILHAFRTHSQIQDVPRFLWSEVQSCGTKVWLESNGFLPFVGALRHP